MATRTRKSRARKSKSAPRCLVIAGPNGAGKTTFASALSECASADRNHHLAAIERALVRAGESARRTARMYGTPIYVWENGKVVAKKP